jgi:hypothetical protein
MGCGRGPCPNEVRTFFLKFSLTPLVDFFDLVEMIGGYDWRRMQYLAGKGRKPFTKFERRYISSQFNFRFKRDVAVSHVSKVEVELYEGIICTSLKNCSLINCL